MCFMTMLKYLTTINTPVNSSLTGETNSMPLIVADGTRLLVDSKLTHLFSILPMFILLAVTWY